MVAFICCWGWKNISACSDIPPHGWNTPTNDSTINYILPSLVTSTLEFAADCFFGWQFRSAVSIGCGLIQEHVT
jgi:hypothetical protein